MMPGELPPRVDVILRACEARRQSERFVFLVPFPISARHTRHLLERECCSALVLKNPDPEITAASSSDWLGCFDEDGGCVFPGRRGTIVFLGPAAAITSQLLRCMRQHRIRKVLCESTDGQLISISVRKIDVMHRARRLVEALANQPGSSRRRRAVDFIRRLPGARRAWHVLTRPGEDVSRVPMFSSSIGHHGGTTLDLSFFRKLASAAVRHGLSARRLAKPGRVVLVNSALAAGGAERQIVNTLSGLTNAGLSDVAFLGEYLHAAPGMDFYFEEVLARSIDATAVRRSASYPAAEGLRVSGELLSLLGHLPGNLGEEILDLAREFEERRPAVIHAWQDSTSIKCAFAAMMSGVPRIVVGSRNVIPENFGYYQPYMKPAYQALAEIPDIVFVNNSEAGASDYCRWLGIGRERFRVIRNGVDLSGLVRAGKAATAGFRQSLGVPDDALLIGSVFRFWAEKRPLLWLHVAGAIARKLPASHFLVIGEGPMREEMETLIRSLGLEGRVHLPGARPDVSLPLSAMDLFLLTSQFEGTPNVVLEAQWIGLPVVATDAGGTREAIEHGITGWCCEQAEIEELARRALDFLHDDAARQRATSAGPHFVSKKFGLRRMIDETLSAYAMDTVRTDPRPEVSPGT